MSGRMQSRRAEEYRYRKRWSYLRAKGIKQTIPADETRLRIATLQGAGWSMRAIAGAAGCSATAVSRLASGKQTAITRKLAERILAVDPAQVPSKPSRQVDEPFVPRTGTQRRLQALLYMGWGYQQMHEHSGIAYPSNLVHQQGRWVTRSTHDTVARMYRELSHRQGPSNRARTWARKLGYVGPASWDDIDLDAAPMKDEALCAVDDCWRTAIWSHDPNITAPSETTQLCRHHADLRLETDADDPHRPANAEDEQAPEAAEDRGEGEAA